MKVIDKLLGNNKKAEAKVKPPVLGPMKVEVLKSPSVLTKSSHALWTKEEDNILLLNPGLSAQELYSLGSLPGRTDKAIFHRLRALKKNPPNQEKVKSNSAPEKAIIRVRSFSNLYEATRLISGLIRNSGSLGMTYQEIMDAVEVGNVKQIPVGVRNILNSLCTGNKLKKKSVSGLLVYYSSDKNLKVESVQKGRYAFVEATDSPELKESKVAIVEAAEGLVLRSTSPDNFTTVHVTVEPPKKGIAPEQYIQTVQQALAAYKDISSFEGITKMSEILSTVPEGARGKFFEYIKGLNASGQAQGAVANLRSTIEAFLAFTKG